mmetsp:Transcript_56042/g.122000  ORF Transcript_56042/g.122000 Transcript_56042/m.122000 type:complete len:191 (+) Transcript_56042:297-869(+)|eukprot:3010078-Pleurochrysis_carterae.AAC.3
MPSNQADSSLQGVESSFKEYLCILTGELLFTSRFPHQIEADGNIVAVCCLGESFEPELLPHPTQSNERVISQLVLGSADLMACSGLQRLELDRTGFVKLWQRYIQELQWVLPECHASVLRREKLEVFSHVLARQILCRFDELEFVGTGGNHSCGGVGIVHYREDGVTPWLWFLAEGVDGVTGSSHQQQTL